MSAPTDITPPDPTVKVEVKAEPKPETDWKAESRKWEDRAKENKGAAEELAKIKQERMTAEERLTAQLSEANKAAELASADALRFKIAARFQISDDDAETFLTGTDQETVIRQAERLQALAGTTVTSAAPRADLSQGARNSTPLNSSELESSLRQALGMRP